MAFELSEETLALIEKVIPRYPQKRSAMMPILHAIQKEKGYLSLEAQEWVAEKLEVTPIKVREVVTFYPFYREHPIGRRHIRVCRTLSCALRGGYQICDGFQEEFGCGLNEISPDGRVTIEFAECLASCGTAPVAMIDDDLHENLSRQEVARLSQQIREETSAAPPETAAVETKEA